MPTPRIPKHIQKNFLYRHIWNNVHQKDLNATFCIIGTPGRGKSTLGLKICEDIDPTFNTNRVCYSVNELVDLLAKEKDEKLKPGAAILFDEIVNEAGSYSRRALSKHNQIMNFIIANMRARRIILIICLPKFTQLDKDIREVGLTGVFQMLTISRQKQMSKAKFKWRTTNEMSGNSFDPFPRLRHPVTKEKLKVTALWFKKPSKQLEKAYKAKKKYYMQTKVQNWFAMLNKDLKKDSKISAKQIAEEIIANPRKYQKDGKYDFIRIMGEYDLGDQKARNITKLAERISKSSL